ncbi:hypothetical protein OLL83_002356 [Shewanella algae]|uniref:hypothetical protein n=1 Tax=Shewanella algae TaxID=38313 RepID=UPI002231A95A|nr:hypothetical protein [Shewanella algae]UZD56682.1 hypothetical protein OLL83_002356 [Shewanella algae]
MLYKYRTLDNFQFLLDILVNNRLFAAKFDSMNDPMEGVYTTRGLVDEEFHAGLKRDIGDIKLCSLSTEKDSPLMWAHYAAGNRGCVIGVELPLGTIVKPVKYYGPSVIDINRQMKSKERARRVLTYKNDFWDYESEVRTFVENGNYQPVVVKEITFGEKADKTTKAIVKKIMAKINPEVAIFERSKD